MLHARSGAFLVITTDLTAQYCICGGARPPARQVTDLAADPKGNQLPLVERIRLSAQQSLTSKADRQREVRAPSGVCLLWVRRPSPHLSVALPFLLEQLLTPAFPRGLDSSRRAVLLGWHSAAQWLLHGCRAARSPKHAHACPTQLNHLGKGRQL